MIHSHNKHISDFVSQAGWPDRMLFRPSPLTARTGFPISQLKPFKTPVRLDSLLIHAVISQAMNFSWRCGWGNE